MINNNITIKVSAKINHTMIKWFEKSFGQPDRIPAL